MARLPVLLGFLLLLALAGSAAAQTAPRTLWVHPAFDKVAGLALPSNATYVAVQSGALTRLDSNGTVVRSLPLGFIQRFAAAPDEAALVTVVGLETTFRDPDYRPLWTYRAPSAVEAAAVSAGGSRTAVGAQDGTLVLLDRGGRPVAGQRLDGPMGAVAISDGGRTLAVSVPGRLLLFDDGLTEVGRLATGSTAVLAVSADGSRVAVGDADGGLRLVDRNGTALFHRARDPPVKVGAVALSGNGSLLLAAWGADVAAIDPTSGATLWRQTFGRPVEALGLSRDGSRAAVAPGGGPVFGLATGFVERPSPRAPPPNATNGTPPPSAAPAPGLDRPTSPPPPPPAPLPVGLLAATGAGVAAAGMLALLHRRGLLLLPEWLHIGKAAKALTRGLAALRRAAERVPAHGPKKPPGEPRFSPPGPKPARPPRPVPRTPRVGPEVARLLRERAREEKTLENLDYMKGRGLLEGGRHGALREETMGRLRGIKQKLEEAGYRS